MQLKQWFIGIIRIAVLQSFLKHTGLTVLYCWNNSRIVHTFHTYVMMHKSHFCNTLPMDTSSSICHRFDFEIPRGKFVEITSILKGESTWKLWHRFGVASSFKIDKISMRSPRRFFYVVSTSINWIIGTVKK